MTNPKPVHSHRCKPIIFEFSSTGEDRYQGVCIMKGTDVVTIEMPAYRFLQDFTPS
jgi:hypothetical protein